MELPNDEDDGDDDDGDDDNCLAASGLQARTFVIQNAPCVDFCCVFSLQFDMHLQHRCTNGTASGGWQLEVGGSGTASLPG